MLGLSLKDSKKLIQGQGKEIPQEVKKLLQEREALRKEKNYEDADKIREKINKLGFIIEDKERGFSIKKR